jgi:DNA repair protein RadC
MELARRYSSEPHQKAKITCPEDIASLLKDMELLDREEFRTICLTAKNHVLSVNTVTIGIADSCLAAPREVFKPAVMKSAVSVIVAHNHPSGDPEPSDQDKLLTQRLKQTGEILGIPVLDHVIIGSNCWVSLKERGLVGR